jgi:hypothetical protein
LPEHALIRSTRHVLLVASLLPLGVLEVRAQPAVLRTEDVFELELASDPQISPDGARVIHVRQFTDITTGQRYSNLWLVNCDLIHPGDVLCE